MERGGAKPSIIVACLVFGLLIGAGQSETNEFPDCYKSCFIICVIAPHANIFECAFKCLKDCLFPPKTPPNSLAIGDPSEYFCRLGCSSSRCTRLSTKSNPAVLKVSDCVDSCSGFCAKH